jgi:hypothetical protein
MFSKEQNDTNDVLVLDVKDNVERILQIDGGEIQKIRQSRFNELPDTVFVTSGISDYTLLDKIKASQNKPLRDYVDEDGIQRGVSPDLKEAFVVDARQIKSEHLEKENVKKVLTGGKQLKRYCTTNVDTYLIYTNRATNFKAIPNIRKFIDGFRDKITCVEVKKKKHSIYSLHRAREEKIFLKEKKLLGVITEDEIKVTIDKQKFFATDGLYLFGTRGISSEYIAGILNSRLFVFLYRLFAIEDGRVLAQVKPTVISELPIRSIDFSNEAEKAKHDHIVSLVKQMLKAKEEFAAAKLDSNIQRLEHRCTTLDRQIDEAVYELYGLTEEEIKIVEGGSTGSPTDVRK